MREMLAVLDAALPGRPRGWLGPGVQTRTDPDAARRGRLTHLLDWCVTTSFPLT